MDWENDLPVPPRFVDGERLDAVHLNRLIDFIRDLAARVSRWNLILSGGCWGLFLPVGAAPGSRNGIEGEKVRNVSLILPGGALLSGEPAGSAGEGSSGDLAEAWLAALPQLLDSNEQGLEWRAPVLHCGAEPRIWALAAALANLLSAVEQSLAKVRGEEAVGAAELRLRIGPTVGGLIAEPRRDPAVLAAQVDPLIEAVQALLKLPEVPLPSLAQQIPGCEARRGLELRQASLANLLAALNALEKSRLPLSPCRETVVPDNRKRVYFLADAEGWLSSRGPSTATYGFTEVENDIPLVYTNLEPNREVAVTGNYLHILFPSDLEILVEVPAS